MGIVWEAAEHILKEKLAMKGIQWDMVKQCYDFAMIKADFWITWILAKIG